MVVSTAFSALAPRRVRLQGCGFTQLTSAAPPLPAVHSPLNGRKLRPLPRPSAAVANSPCVAQSYGDYETLCPKVFTEASLLASFPNSTMEPWTVLEKWGPTASGLSGFSVQIPEMDKVVMVSLSLLSRAAAASAVAHSRPPPRPPPLARCSEDSTSPTGSSCQSRVHSHIPNPCLRLSALAAGYGCRLFRLFFVLEGIVGGRSD